jgi:ADP-heptose:LPS heptosyltransferase
VPESGPDKWLAVRLSALGDVVLTTGVLAYLAENHGRGFHFLTREAFAPVFLHNPAVEQVVSPQEKTLKAAAWIGSARKLAERYRGWGLLDLHGSLRSRVLGLFWKGPVERYPKFSLQRRLYGRFGLASAQRRLVTYNVPQRYSLASLPEAPPRSELRPRVYLSEEERSRAAGTLAEIGVERPAVALHPYATHAAKAWPEEHWRALAEMVQSGGMDWFVVGKSGHKLFDDPRDLTGATDVRQTAALIEQADALVSNDSGPMHLATAVGTRVLALFGPTHPAWGFAPSGGDDLVIQLDMGCRPCHVHGGRGCRRGEACLRDITPEQVLAHLA